MGFWGARYFVSMYQNTGWNGDWEESLSQYWDIEHNSIGTFPDGNQDEEIYLQNSKGGILVSFHCLLKEKRDYG
jgi:hypothetical protein